MSGGKTFNCAREIFLVPVQPWSHTALDSAVAKMRIDDHELIKILGEAKGRLSEHRFDNLTTTTRVSHNEGNFIRMVILLDVLDEAGAKKGELAIAIPWPPQSPYAPNRPVHFYVDDREVVTWEVAEQAANVLAHHLVATPHT